LDGVTQVPCDPPQTRRPQIVQGYLVGHPLIAGTKPLLRRASLILALDPYGLFAMRVRRRPQKRRRCRPNGPPGACLVVDDALSVGAVAGRPPSPAHSALGDREGPPMVSRPLPTRVRTKLLSTVPDRRRCPPDGRLRSPWQRLRRSGGVGGHAGVVVTIQTPKPIHNLAAWSLQLGARALVAQADPYPPTPWPALIGFAGSGRTTAIPLHHCPLVGHTGEVRSKEFSCNPRPRAR